MATAADATITVTMEDFPEVKQVIDASIPFWRCLCEFGGDMSFCGEHFEAWSDAMEDLKRVQTGAK